MILSAVGRRDFNFLLSTLGLTRGGLSRNTERLKLAGYVKAGKAFKGKLRTPAISSPGKTPGL